jgi:hypothetical protein
MHSKRVAYDLSKGAHGGNNAQKGMEVLVLVGSGRVLVKRNSA